MHRQAPSVKVSTLCAVAALLVGGTSCASRRSEPVAFTSDGCSASPNGPASDPQRWRSACAIHDYRYWRGGTPKERLDADRELSANIVSTGNPLVAQVYFLGVRLGGSAWLPTRWRWGYAWDYPRGYGYLSDQEKAALDALMSDPPGQ